ncbi:hypothetical protein, partial [Lysobacter sp. TAB13]|uniref:hypothetical protein n=1 Tax=Lysobacter sp. TAB13 TaxID=3233065 RepID=UPI003F98AAED
VIPATKRSAVDFLGVGDLGGRWNAHCGLLTSRPVAASRPIPAVWPSNADKLAIAIEPNNMAALRGSAAFAGKTMQMKDHLIAVFHGLLNFSGAYL